MALVAEGWDRKVDWLAAVRARFGLGGLVRPDLLRGLARPDGRLFAVEVTLTRCGNEACVDDLSRARDDACLVDRVLQLLEQGIEGFGLDLRFAEIPQHVRIRDCVGDA